MIENSLGTAIILYTFTSNGNVENYKNKVDTLKKLLPDKIHELEDQSSILIQTRCDIENLQKAIKDKYAEQLEEKESITLISIDGDCLKCMCIQHTSLEKETEAVLKEFCDETDITKIPKLAENLVNMLRENTKIVLNQIIK